MCDCERGTCDVFASGAKVHRKVQKVHPETSQQLQYRKEGRRYTYSARVSGYGISVAVEPRAGKTEHPQDKLAATEIEGKEEDNLPTKRSQRNADDGQQMHS